MLICIFRRCQEVITISLLYYNINIKSSTPKDDKFRKDFLLNKVSKAFYKKDQKSVYLKTCSRLLSCKIDEVNITDVGAEKKKF